MRNLRTSAVEAAFGFTAKDAEDSEELRGVSSDPASALADEDEPSPPGLNEVSPSISNDGPPSGMNDVSPSPSLDAAISNPSSSVSSASSVVEVSSGGGPKSKE